MENKTTIINIAKDFSKYPGGRFLADGDFSGTRFRSEVLVPALERYECVRIELDGTLGYGSSFLEEAFGGLVREGGFTASDLRNRLDLNTGDENLSYTIRRYIDEATSNGSQMSRAAAQERVSA